MKILITGGLGVNGAWVTRKLIERGHEPVVFENRPDYSLVDDLRGAFKLVRGDVNDLAGLVRACKEHEVQRVVNMAALMPPDAQADPLNGFRVNAFGTVQVLEAARITNVERVVFTSSRAAYGDIPPGEFGHPNYRPVDEDHPLNPSLVYDVCKVASEGMGRNYQRNYGIQFVALRFASIFGPGKLARHGNVSIYSRLIEDSLAGKPVRISKGGDQRDDMIYVKDVAEAIVLAALHDRPEYPAYNIASGQGRTLKDFSDAVSKAIPDADIAIGPGLDFFDMGVNYYAVFDTTRAREDLGFVPRFSLEESIRDYISIMQRLGLSPLTNP